MLQLGAGLVEHFAERQRHGLQMHGESLEIRRGKRAEKTILGGPGGEVHFFAPNSTPMPR